MSSSFDAHYTPRTLAAEMADVGLELDSYPREVIDIACGDGALLSAVAARAPCAHIVGIDIDRSAAQALVRRFPYWSISTANALSSSSRSQTPAAATWGSVDLAVLNPPFSCRGQRTVPVNLDGVEIRCSPHMAFALVALQSLSPSGRMVAILPAGARRLVRDQAAWAAVDQSCVASVRSTYKRHAFPGVTASTELHVIDRRKQWAGAVELPAKPDLPCDCPQPVRGWQQIHSAVECRDGLPLVHSTHLVDGCVKTDLTVSVSSTRKLTAPAVLLPRVGKPNSSKIAVLVQSEIVLSDCVFAIPCTSLQGAEQLRARMLAAWPEIEGQYGGSCAPHLTLEGLRSVLCRLDH